MKNLMITSLVLFSTLTFANNKVGNKKQIKQIKEITTKNYCTRVKVRSCRRIGRKLVSSIKYVWRDCQTGELHE